MQALNTSSLFELMESLGATGECQVEVHFLNVSKKLLTGIYAKPTAKLLQDQGQVALLG